MQLAVECGKKSYKLAILSVPVAIPTLSEPKMFSALHRSPSLQTMLALRSLPDLAHHRKPVWKGRAVELE
jgi:hypothetical protein